MKARDIYGEMGSSTQDDETMLSLCTLLGNRVSFGIIKSTIESPRSAVGISRENRIPLSSVYRQIRRLQKVGIIQVESKARNKRNSKSIAYYRCKLQSVRMSLDENGPRISVKIQTE